MKKTILFLSIILAGVYLSNFISAISVNLNSGDTLTSDTWGKIASVTDKISVESGDMKINGKIYISGKLCLDNGQCLGECTDADEHWDNASASCVTSHCLATTKTVNAHNYDVLALNNGITSALLTSTTTESITGGTKYFKQAFQCNTGVLSESGSETSSITCETGYNLSGESCVAVPGNSSANPGTSCLDLKNRGVGTNGVYRIQPSGYSAFQAYCIMDWNGGGYTVVGLSNSVRVNVSPGGSDVGSVPSSLTSSTANFMFSTSKISAISGNNLYTYAGYGDGNPLIVKHDVTSWYVDKRTSTGDKLYNKSWNLLTPSSRRYSGRNHGPGIMRSGGDTRCGLIHTHIGYGYCASGFYKIMWKESSSGRTTLNGPMLLLKK